MFLEIDFEKAYDKLNWNYPEKVMTRMSFGVKWFRWMEACVFLSSLSILTNES